MTQTLAFDFGPIPAAPARMQTVPVRSHTRRGRVSESGRVSETGRASERPAETAPYVKGSETSQAAASAIDAAGSAEKGRAKVLAALRKYGPLTDERIMALTGMDGNSVRPRRGELKKAGKVRDSGDKGKTVSGRAAVLWEAAE